MDLASYALGVMTVLCLIFLAAAYVLAKIYGRR